MAMIIKMNGTILSGPADWIDKANDWADNMVDLEVGSVVEASLHAIGEVLLSLNHQVVSIMPELAVMAAIICITVGMFSSFGKWAGRAAIFYLGGAAWIVLSGGTA